MAIQATFSSTSRKGPVCNFGIIIPCNVKQAFKLDANNGNKLWKDAMTKEIEHIQSYQTFKDMGKVTHLSGYKKIIWKTFLFAKSTTSCWWSPHSTNHGRILLQCCQPVQSLHLPSCC
jgi:hypothetical protein